MRILQYQENAIQDLNNKSKELLKLSMEKPHIVFSSPTGSGKTYMLSEYLALISSQIENLVFIWLAPRQLHIQSQNKIKKYNEKTNKINPIFFDNISDNQLTENEVLFLNWESINKKDNLIYRENEQDFYLEKIINNTKLSKLKIILIVDESHHAMDTEKSQGLINIINPDLTLSVSATPKNITTRIVENVNVYRQNVIAEGMIKRNVKINENFQGEIEKEKKLGIELKTEASKSTNEFMLEIALSKRECLQEIFQKNNSNVNPLLLIQLPDKKQNSNFDLEEEVIELLNDRKINADNGKLAIWLSKEKINTDNIEDNQNAVEVMIFKQAIALGWDCPRAHIILTFRDWKKFEFSTQTLGRIMRTPESKLYDIDLLDSGYVYTNGENLSIHRDISEGYATFNNSLISKSLGKIQYEDIKLKSFSLIRNREKTRLDPSFIDDFMETAKIHEIASKISMDSDSILEDFITDKILELNDETTTNDSIAQREISAVDLQKVFVRFIEENTSPLYPESRTVKRIIAAIYIFFANELNLNFSHHPDLFLKGTSYTNEDYIKRVILDKKNIEIFTGLISKSIEKYQRRQMQSNEQEFKENIFTIKDSKNYSNNVKKVDSKLSIMQPLYIPNDSPMNEYRFIEFLDNKSKTVSFYLKNGDSGTENFAVKYENEIGKKAAFYVDWIIKFKDGSIGLYDTKSGWTAEDANTRAQGLYEYILEENNKGKNLKGGIVIPTKLTEKDIPSLDHSGWLVHDGKDYFYNKDMNDQELKSHNWQEFNI